MPYTATVNVTTGIFKRTLEELNGHEEMIIELPNSIANRALVAADQSADLVWTGPVTLFEGTCKGAKHTRGMLECIVYNEAYEKLQGFQPFNTSYTATAASVILIALGAHVGIAVSWDPVPDPDVSFRFDYANPMDVLIALAEATGYDYWTTTGPLTIHVGTRGANKGAIAVLEDSARVLDRAKQRNNVRIRGVDADGNVIYGTANAGAADRYATFTERKPSDQATLDALAANKLDDLNKDTGPSPLGVSIIVGNALFPGDTVTLNEVHLQLVGAYRLWKVERFIDKVVIYPESPDMTEDQAIWNTRKYEDLGIYIIGTPQLPLGIQGWSTDLQIVPGVAAANKHNSFEWDDGAAGNAELRFSDGTVIVITAGNFAGLAASTTFIYYIKTSEDPTTLYLAAGHGDLDEVDHLAVVKIITPAAGATTMEVEVQPLLSNTETVPQFGTTLLSAGVIITPDFRTAWDVGDIGGPAGFRITPSLIASYAAGNVKEFYVDAATGFAYFAGGSALINSSGLTIKADNADFITFQTAAGGAIGSLGTGYNNLNLALIAANKRIYIGLTTGPYILLDDLPAGNTGRVTIASSDGEDVVIVPGAGDVEVWTGDLYPRGTPGTCGTVGFPWDEGHFDDVYGTVRYSDMHFIGPDLDCFKCGRPFGMKDGMKLHVKGFGEDKVVGREMLAVPVHAHCMIARFRGLFNGLLR